MRRPTEPRCKDALWWGLQRRVARQHPRLMTCQLDMVESACAAGADLQGVLSVGQQLAQVLRQLAQRLRLPLLQPYQAALQRLHGCTTPQQTQHWAFLGHSTATNQAGEPVLTAASLLCMSEHGKGFLRAAAPTPAGSCCSCHTGKPGEGFHRAT